MKWWRNGSLLDDEDWPNHVLKKWWSTQATLMTTASAFQHTGYSDIQNFGINTRKAQSMHLLLLDILKLYIHLLLHSYFRQNLTALLWKVNTFPAMEL